MEIRVEHPKLVSIGQEILEYPVDKLASLKPFGSQTLQDGLIISLERSKIVENVYALDEFSDQYSTRDQVFHYFRHALVGIMLYVLTMLLHVTSFAAVVELFICPGGKFTCGLDHPVQTFQAQTLDQKDGGKH